MGVLDSFGAWKGLLLWLNKRMKRKRRTIAAVLAVTVLLLLIVRPFQARSYMNQQIERLSQEGSAGYKVYERNYFTFSDYAHFPCITLKARREIAKDEWNDGYSRIAVDFSWIPFIAPEHRI